MTKGQQFAKDMRKNLGIGTRTPRNRKGTDLHISVLASIEHAKYDAGWYRQEREDLYSAASGAWLSFDAHIASRRANSLVIAYVNSLTPYQFCALLGDMVDAGITNVGQGERYFADMARSLHTQAA